MSVLKISAAISLISVTMTACTTGDLRAFNDAMSGQNGYTVSYPDQRDTDYVGNIKLVTGVKSGSYFQIVKNTGDDYCKVKVIYENGNDSIFNLDPDESTGTVYGSVYNQVDRMRTLCNSTNRVFAESFS